VFAQFFGSTDVLYDILQSKSLDVMYCKGKVDEVCDKLQQERNVGFNRVWDAANAGQKLVMHRPELFFYNLLQLQNMIVRQL